MIMELLRWKDVASKLPNRSLVLAVMNKLSSFDESCYYRPSWKIWKQIAYSLSLFAKLDPSNWKLVRTVLRVLLGEVGYTVRLDLLSIGLAASEALLDSQLAIDLLQKSIPADNQMVGDSFDDGDPVSDLGEVQHKVERSVPPEAYRKALDICIASGDLENCFVVLDLLSQSIPSAAQAEFYAATIKGCVVRNLPERALELLHIMREKGLSIR